jgi:hypothetical protein
MYEKDYIMKMVEAFSRMIARIMGLKEKGELNKAEALILEAYDTILKIDPDTLRNFDDRAWDSFCRQRTPQELEMIADLFRVEGEIRIDLGDHEGVCRLLFKSLELLKYVDDHTDTFSVLRFDKISSLEQKLSGADY